MTDWRRVFGFEKHTYVQSFPITSFLLSGVSFYKDTIKDISIGDILDMTIEPNKYDNSAIIIKKITNVCGYVPKDIKEKVKSYVPSQVKVIDKRLIENNIYSLRVDIIKKEDSENINLNSKEV
jgi:hypothetical protein